MTLRLRNTLTRRVEPVEPLEPGRVRMYTCGPTVYRYAHVGNLRSNLLGGADYLIRDRATTTAPLSPEGRDLHDRFVDAIDDDLDMPAALALVRTTPKAPITADERRWLILDADAVLGLALDRVGADTMDAGAEADQAIPTDVAALFEVRAVARAERNFTRADGLRAEIASLGWDVTDGPTDSVLTRRGPSSTD